MNKIRTITLALGIVLGIGFMAPAGVYAESVIDAQCAQDQDVNICKQNTDSNGLVKNIINVLLYLIGAISVVMIIAGGIMYAVSAGDSGQVTKAKNTILYAVLGLVVAFLAYALVQFVFRQFVKP